MATALTNSSSSLLNPSASVLPAGATDYTGLNDPFGLNAQLQPSVLSGGASTPSADPSILSDSDIFNSGDINASALTGGSLISPGTASSVSGSLGDGTGSILGDLGSLGSSIAGSGLGTLAGYAGVYELLAGQAANTQTQNNQLASQITNVGAPSVASGNAQLAKYNAGQLNTPYQEQYNNAVQLNQNTATSQTQQVSQLLAGASSGNIQSAMASQGQQITSAQAQANAAALSTAFSNELGDAMKEIGVGGPYVQAGVEQEIQSNTALQGQLAQLMGSLAQAYAKSGQSLTSGLSGIGSALSSLFKDLTGAGGTAAKLATGSNSGSGLTEYNPVNGTYEEIPYTSPDLLDPSSTDNIAGGEWDFSGLDTSELGSEAGDALDTSLGSEYDDLASTFGFNSAGGEAATAASSAAGDLTEYTPTAGSLVPVPGGSSSAAAGALGSVGAGLSLYNEIQNPTYSGGVAAANAAVQAAGAIGGAGSAAAGVAAAVAPWAGPVGLVAGMAEAISANEQRGPPLTINGPGITQNPYGKLGSGNSIATIGDIGIGEGNNEAQGSGQLYKIDPTGSTTNNTVYNWLGQKDTNDLIDAYNAYEGAGGVPQVSNSINFNGAVPGIGGVYLPGGHANPGIQNISNVFAESGGQAYWGVDQNAFDTSIEQIFTSMQNNGGSGFSLGRG